MQFCIKAADGHVSDLITIPGNPGTGPAPAFLTAQAAATGGSVLEVTTPIVDAIDLAICEEDPEVHGKLVVSKVFAADRDLADAVRNKVQATENKSRLQAVRAASTDANEQKVLDAWITEATVSVVEAGAAVITASGKVDEAKP